MSGSFTGFSEEDIKKLNHTKIKQIHANEHGVKKAALNSNHSKKHVIPINYKLLENTIVNSHIEPISDAAKLCPVPKLPAVTKELSTMSNTQELETKLVNCDKDTIELLDITATKDTVKVKDNVENEVENNFVQLQERKLDLAQFQERQKIIEEQNKKRQALLAKALAVRTQQTREEAQKLETIRSEFKKLDMILSSDVKILRHQIEIASLDYMEAEKRYYRIEREFLEAKLALHQKLEKKEMLTEHLCAVIEKNEERKAEKLNDLLNKLNLRTDFCDTSESTDIKAKNSDNVNYIKQ